MNYYDYPYIKSNGPTDDCKQIGDGGPSYPGGSQARFGGGQQPGFPPPFGGGGQQPGFPPPFGGGGQQPGFSPPFGGGQQQDGPPASPPPAMIPPETASTFAVDPGGIRRCLYRFTYIRLNNGNSFWYYPTFVGRTSVAGYRWRRFRWVYFGIDLNRIRSFSCY